MKIHIKLPGGIEAKLEKESGDWFWIFPVACMLLALMGLFFTIWLLR